MSIWLVGLGAFCFGTVIGWVAKEAMVRTDKLSISHIAVIIGALGGAGITKLFDTAVPFAMYCIGLACGFFALTLLYDIDDRTGKVILRRGKEASSREPRKLA
jgi:uncharacterized membrane protein YeaQ/YmgE (transglycosylase-associated protein family)